MCLSCLHIPLKALLQLQLQFLLCSLQHSRAATPAALTSAAYILHRTAAEPQSPLCSVRCHSASLVVIALIVVLQAKAGLLGKEAYLSLASRSSVLLLCIL